MVRFDRPLSTGRIESIPVPAGPALPLFRNPRYPVKADRKVRFQTAQPSGPDQVSDPVPGGFFYASLGYQNPDEISTTIATHHDPHHQ